MLKRLFLSWVLGTALCGCGSEQSIPVAPSNLSASAASSTQINLTWTDNSNNETSFKVERAKGFGVPVQFTTTYSQVSEVSANVTFLSDTALTPSTTYFYRISATNSAGDSVYSNEVIATTPASPGG
jgi:hypothetical protein